MSLTRLENFLKTVRGSVIYVNTDSLDATDSVENIGSSLTRPFKTIQRAVVEAVRYSYRSGFDNDQFAKTTIIVFPGQYDIDNRPGVLVRDNGSLVFRSSATATLPEWRLSSNFNIYDPTNELYKLNSVFGGVILPRGVTLWAYDAEKTIIRPLYVPSPTNSSITESCIFRLTGSLVPERFSFFDSNPNDLCYRDYTTNRITPNFSHHKLSVYEFVDGVSKISIKDDFLNVTTTRTDLEMYYEKIAAVYGLSSGRAIQDAVYSSAVTVDIEPIVDEYRIIGSKGKEVGITSIRSGNGNVATNTITATLNERVDELSVDTPVQISGVGQAGYDGQFVVYSVSTVNNVSVVQYKSSIVPSVINPSSVGAALNIVVDSVTGSPPIIRQNTLRSVYGMSLFNADGNSISGFKNAIVTDVRGISLQKDDDAFVKYDPVSGSYKDSTSVSNLHKDPKAKYKPDYEHSLIKARNDIVVEISNTTSVGFAKQYFSESGGEASLVASRSDYGAKAFTATGFKKTAYAQDDKGFIVGFIPPKNLQPNIFNVECYSFDVGLTTSIGNTSRLYIANEKNFDKPPEYIVDGYKFGARTNEILNLELSNGNTVGIFTASVLPPNNSSTSEKVYNVQRVNNNTENSIFNNVFDLTTNHNLITGEKIRLYSDNGHLPDGIDSNKIGFAITTGLASSRIKIAESFNDALSNNPIILNRKGGNLQVISKISDKLPGEFGHPVQWDFSNNNWYVNCNTSNSIYNQINTLGVGTLGTFTPNSFIEREFDQRSDDERIFRLRYVIPANTNQIARPPLEDFILQESNNVVLSSDELSKYFSDSFSTLNNANELRNSHYIASVNWVSNIATIKTELASEVSIGTKIELFNFSNGIYTVTSVISDKTFTVSMPVNPGAFNKDTTTRDSNLPYFKKLETPTTFKIHKIVERQEYVYTKQDGVYDLIVINNSNSPTVSPFTGLNFSQPIENVYPILDRDNIVYNPKGSTCFAVPDKIGQVVINDVKNSITRETFNKFTEAHVYGIKISSIESNLIGLAHTFTTEIAHNFKGITGATLSGIGSNYVPGTYFAADVIANTGAGVNANARITVNGSGNISSFQIMESGSAYSVGDVARLIPAAGIGTTTGFIPATITITNVNDNLNDTLYLNDNSMPFRIVGIDSSNKIRVESPERATNLIPSYAVSSDKAVAISSFVYSATTGIATVACASSHGVTNGDSVRLGGFVSDYFNKEVVVESLPNSQSVVVNIGKKGGSLSTSGTRFLFPSLSANNDKVTYMFAGITTTMSGQLTAESTSDVLVISNAVNTGLIIGDYLKVNDEIFRIKSDITSNNVSVFRGLFATKKQTHSVNSVVKKIKVLPIELRKASNIRASAHTFNSVGIGPGNYSTSIPERQNINLSDKEKDLSYSFNINGGQISYDAMDENGRKLKNNKTGDNIVDITNPIYINTKLISYSEKGIEANNFLIEGKRIGFASTTPNSGSYGDIIYNTSPRTGNYIGWSYTINNQWEGFGKIGP